MNDTGYLLAGIGAAGGLLAGLINFLFRPLSEHNRMIWKHIQKTYLIDQTLNNLVFTFGFDQAVRSNLLEPLANLELEVRRDSSSIRFKTFFDNAYRKNLLSINEEFHVAMDHIDGPYGIWSDDAMAWLIRPTNELLSATTDAERSEVMQACERVQKEILNSFEEILRQARILEHKADRQPYEYILPWKWHLFS